MQKTLLLAKKGLGRTYPNPVVGAVIIKNGAVIGSGYHHQAGVAHAEIEALRSCKASTRGAILYVNLEPCAHQGKTPPCVDAIIAAGISQVVCATLDPNPLVSGKGVAYLRRAGLKVTVGLLEPQTKALNEAYFMFHTEHRPFIAIKFAASLDGKIATASHDSKWITNKTARDYARKLRGHYQAVLVGVNTVIQDNPHLGSYHDPLRIILDSSLRTPLESQVFRDSNVLIVTTKRAPAENLQAFASKNITVLQLPSQQIKLESLLKELAKRDIVSIFVEGGGSVLGSFVDKQLVDRLYAFYGPLIIGGQASIPAVAGEGAAQVAQSLQLNRLRVRRFDDTFLISGYPKN